MSCIRSERRERKPQTPGEFCPSIHSDIMTEKVQPTSPDERRGDSSPRANQANRPEEEQTGPSNEYVLNVAFLSFLSFVLVQTAFALIARSQAMLADSMAMSVDAFTYLFNLLAERLKNRPISDDESIPMHVRLRNHKRTRLYLELFPPLISVATLIGVSVYVFMDAVDAVIVHCDNRSMSDADETNSTEPNARIMFLFSFLNLLLDIVNVSFFANVKSLGFSVLHYVGFGGAETELTQVVKGEVSKCDAVTSSGSIPVSPSENTCLLESSSYAIQIEEEKKDGDSCDETSYGSTELGSITVIEEGRMNLNMCSAYTHVMADTMRSVTVLIAAGLATVIDSISPDMADAVGAIIVSFIIAISLGPLLSGLFETWSQIRELNEADTQREQETSACVIIV